MIDIKKLRTKEFIADLRLIVPTIKSDSADLVVFPINFIAKIPPSFPSVSLLRLPERAQLLVGGIRVLLLPLLI